MAGVVPELPKFQFSNALGGPLVNGTVTVYLAGTTTLTNTWQDVGLTVLNQNPITLDSRGEALIYLDPALSYKFVLKNALGATQWTVDDIAGRSADSVRFIRSGNFATGRTSQDKMRDILSAKDTAGVTGNAGEDQGTALNNAIADASARGLCDLYLPDGTYDTTVPILQLPGVTLRLAKNAQIRATAAMANLLYVSPTQMLYECGVFGGRLLCNNLADVGYDPQFYQHLTIDGLTIEDYLLVGCRLGATGTATSSYEAMVHNLRTFRAAGTVQANSIALHIRAGTDSAVTQSVLQGAEIGAKTETGDNTFSQVHAWTRSSTGALKTGFWDVSFGNVYSVCTADTPTQYGWKLDGRRYALQGNYLLNGAFGGLDNVVIGVLLNNSTPQSSVVGQITEGLDATHRVLTDIDYSAAVFTGSPILTLVGNTAAKNVTNVAPTLIPQVLDFEAKGTFDHAITLDRTLRLWRNATTGLLRAKSGTPSTDSDGIPLGLKKLTGTTSGSIGTGVTVAHGLGYSPTYVMIQQRGIGTVYETARDATNITVAGTAASLNFDIYVG